MICSDVGFGCGVEIGSSMSWGSVFFCLFLGIDVAIGFDDGLGGKGSLPMSEIFLLSFFFFFLSFTCYCFDA